MMRRDQDSYDNDISQSKDQCPPPQDRDIEHQGRDAIKMISNLNSDKTYKPRETLKKRKPKYSYNCADIRTFFKGDGGG